MNSWIFFVIIIFLILDFFIVLFVYLKKSKKKLGPQELQYINSHWIRIIDSFKNNPKGSVLDADKLLDYALSKYGYQGSLGDKLKKSGSIFKDLNGVWNAHKLRNRIAHELGDIDEGHAKRALKQFKQALNDLGAGL